MASALPVGSQPAPGTGSEPRPPRRGRVLLLTPQSPWPPRQGTAVRNWHIARELASRYRVSILAFGSSDDAVGLRQAGIEPFLVPSPAQRSLLRRATELAITLTPDLVRRLRSAAMTNALLRLLDESRIEADPFAVIQVEGLEMAAYGEAARNWWLRSGTAGRLIYDAHNAEWLLQHRAWQADLRRLTGWPGAAYSFVQTLKLRRFEAHFLRRVDGAIAVSRADRLALQRLAPRQQVVEVPNGVDTDYYRPADRAREVPGRCLFVGKMDFRPNIDAMAWFVTQVWPRIRREQPHAELRIVGRQPVPRVLALAGDGVAVAGEVADVRPELEAAAVVLAPLRVGGGTRLKILEAMAMAKAVVATSLGAEGLEVKRDEELLVADEPADLAQAVVTALRDPQRRAQLGECARARVEACYRWQTLVPRMEGLYPPAIRPEV